jgi:hypothetical protein
VLAARRAWLNALAPWLCATGFRRFCSEQRRTRLSTAGVKPKPPFGTSNAVPVPASGPPELCVPGFRPVCRYRALGALCEVEPKYFPNGDSQSAATRVLCEHRSKATYCTG